MSSIDRVSNLFRIVSKDEIISIALAYQYLANQKSSLSEFEAISYFESVCEFLKRYQDMIFCEEESWYLRNYVMNYQSSKSEFSLLPCIPYEFSYLYNKQPYEVIGATLQEQALNEIHVCRDVLPIETQFVLDSGHMEIYTLEAKRAQEITKECLERDGCRHIRIGLTIPDQLEGDKGYHVAYSCNRPYEKVKLKKLFDRRG